MPLLDFKCPACGQVDEDVFKKQGEPHDCSRCGTTSEVTWEKTKTMNFGVPFSQSLDNATGTARNSFGADDDPICRAELFMDEDTGHGLTRLPRKQREEFLEKRIKDGDSSELRKEVLKAHKEAKAV